MSKQALRWRLFAFFCVPAGIVFFLWFLATVYFGTNPFFSFEQKLSILPEGIFVLAALWYYRRNKIDYAFSFGEGIGMAFVLMLLATMVYSLLTYYWIEIISPELVTNQIEVLRKYLEVRKESLIRDSSLEIYQNNLKGLKDISAYSLVWTEAFMKVFVKGLMFGILISLVFRRSDPYLSSNMTQNSPPNPS